jgi:acetyl-CoA synthetase
MGAGDKYVTSTSRKSLRLLGTVGEPINPEAWRWYFEVVGESRCPIVDTYWQTETGSHMLTPLPTKNWKMKAGSATLPSFGVQPAIIDNEGNELLGDCEGMLAFKAPWPSALRGVWGDTKRFEETYFSYKGFYLTGDGARRDADGDYWITGRIDDVVIVSGHNLGTAEIESAIVLHPSVAEAAAVGVPHNIKGQALYVFVTLVEGAAGSDALGAELKALVREKVGAFASPDTFQWAPRGVPKTRSGKIMRRILRKVATLGAQVTAADLGDTTTLADPTVVGDLIAGHAGVCA